MSENRKDVTRMSNINYSSVGHHLIRKAVNSSPLHCTCDSYISFTCGKNLLDFSLTHSSKPVNMYYPYNIALLHLDISFVM